MLEIINRISERNQVPAAEVLSRKRSMPLPQIRHQVFATAYKGGYTQVAIAERFGVTQSAVSKGIINHILTSKR